MSMIKVLQSGGWDFHEPATQLVKMSSRGLVGNDLSAFIKRAGLQVADMMNRIKFASDETPIHLIAVGATEDYGPNRNGDGFDRNTCKTAHDTFEKFAYFYRNHKNKDPLKSYGVVKRAFYNEPMQRIELICGLNRTKEAAARNNGLVADKEHQKLANGDDIPVSMACKVAFDVCSGCGNKARHRGEYCRSTEGGGHCKYGGLMHNMGQVMSDGHILHADNPNPRYFDISHVYRPADRIAYVMGELQKAASHGVIGGAELAEALGVDAPYMLYIEPGMPTHVAHQIKLANWMADEEKAVERCRAAQHAAAFAPEMQVADQPPFTAEQGHRKFASLLRACVDQKILLPLETFLSITTGNGHEKCAELAEYVKLALPGTYGRLLHDSSVIGSNPYVPSPSTTDDMRFWAKKQASALSLASYHVDRRVKVAALRQLDRPQLRSPSDPLVKTASNGGPAAKMAQEYALYKLAFLSSIPESDPSFPLTASLCVLQNYC